MSPCTLIKLSKYRPSISQFYGSHCLINIKLKFSILRFSINSLFEFSGEVFKIEQDPLFIEQKRLKKSKLRDKRKKSFPCGKCDYVATKFSNLKTHILSKHEGTRYSCNQCKYTATDSSSLKKHIKNKHEGVRYPLSLIHI